MTCVPLLVALERRSGGRNQFLPRRPHRAPLKYPAGEKYRRAAMREGGGFRETPPPSLKYPLLLLIFRLITDFDIISCNIKK